MAHKEDIKAKVAEQVGQLFVDIADCEENGDTLSFPVLINDATHTSKDIEDFVESLISDEDDYAVIDNETLPDGHSSWLIKFYLEN
jgi:hypothetical protein